MVKEEAVVLCFLLIFLRVSLLEISSFCLTLSMILFTLSGVSLCNLYGGRRWCRL